MRKKNSSKMQEKPRTAEWIFQFWAWQLLLWTLYRYYLHYPEWVDEFLFKPAVFVVPVLWYVLVKEKRSLTTVGITGKRIGSSALLGVGIGIAFLLEGLFVHLVSRGSLTLQQLPSVSSYSFGALIALSFATAFSEELLSRGFLFSRLYEQTKRIWYSIVLSTLMFVAFHIPILITSLKFQGATLVIFLVTSVTIGIINSVLFLEKKSIITPLLVHFFWNITVALFL